MIRLYNDDCLIKMGKLIQGGVKVDAIITDAPYGMNFQSHYRKQEYNKIINDDDLSWIDEFITKSYTLLNDNSHAYFFCSFHNVDIFKQSIEKKFKIKNILIWEKNNTGMGDLKGNYAPKYEMIIFATKGRKILNGRRDANILHFNRTGNKFHPTQKPVDLLEYLINKSTNENDWVLDMFMGSGSTGVACKNTNRNFIGIELDKTYFDIAQKRIDEVTE